MDMRDNEDYKDPATTEREVMLTKNTLNAAISRLSMARGFLHQTASKPPTDTEELTEPSAQKKLTPLVTPSKPKSFRTPPLVCTIDVSFWQRVIYLKINTWKLECPELALKGYIEPSVIGSGGGLLRLDESSIIEPSIKLDSSSIAVALESGQAMKKKGSPCFWISGTFLHVNTKEELETFPFHSADGPRVIRFEDVMQHSNHSHSSQSSPVRASELEGGLLSKGELATAEKGALTYHLGHSKPIWQSMGKSNEIGRNPPSWDSIIHQRLLRFTVIAFMDLKRYEICYAVSVPMFDFRPPPTVDVVAPHSKYIKLEKASEDTKNHRPRQLMKFTVGKNWGFSPQDITHVGKHLYHTCYCHNGDTLLSTAGACIVRLRGCGSPSLFGELREVQAPEFISMEPIINQAYGRVQSILRESNTFLCLIDFSGDARSMSPVAYNIFLFICDKLRLFNATIQLFLFRDHEQVIMENSSYGAFRGVRPSLTAQFQSICGVVHVPPREAFEGIEVNVGWLRCKKTLRLSDNSSHILAAAEVGGALSDEFVFKLGLQSFLDPHTIQQNAVELNVKLIKWRILPSFDPYAIQNMRFLIVGMGTLGCIVARELVGWGALHFTLLDCGIISPSNPARQYLYLAKDVELGNPDRSGALLGIVPGASKKKVDVARERLLEVRADLDIQTIDMEIPMPGQPRFLLPVKCFTEAISEEDAVLNRTYVSWSHKLLLSLIKRHQVMFLLTDTRESRWLPALLSQHISRENFMNSHVRTDSPWYPPLCVTVALGFDTFVVMRHGRFSDSGVFDLVESEQREQSPALKMDLPENSKVEVNSQQGSRSTTWGDFHPLKSRLSCYFCNDLAAPSHLFWKYRTLDQQCTVSRSGLAGMASSIAVELVATLSQAETGFNAIPDDRKNDIMKWVKINSTGCDHLLRLEESLRNHNSCLGSCPHVVRGSVGNFTLSTDWQPNFQMCICCSEGILDRYASDPESFLEAAMKDSLSLEKWSGLAALKCRVSQKEHFETEKILEDEEVLLIGDTEVDSPP